MKKVVYFEIGADDPERAAKFYTEIFGWEFKKWEGGEPYWVITTGAHEEKGINGGMFMRKKSDLKNETPTLAEARNFIVTIQVPSVDEYSKMVLEKGGQKIKDKIKVAAVGWLEYLSDPEGNIFGIMESDKSLI